MPGLPPAVRSALGYLSRDRVLRRRLPARLGGRPVLVSPDAALSFWRWDLDRTNGAAALAAAERHVRPGDRVFDVGSNLGLFALAAARLSGPSGGVTACEPDPQFADLIGRSVRLADDPAAGPIRVLTVAVAGDVGLAELAVARLGRASSHLTGLGADRGTAGGVRFTRSVVTVTLDWLADRVGPPTLVKVDVEGAEVAVLDGAAATLTRHRPRLLIEVGPETTSEVGRRLTAAGYRTSDADGRPVTDVAGFAGDLYAEPGPS
jgi:FkbM family methyltransferase